METFLKQSYTKTLAPLTHIFQKQWQFSVENNAKKFWKITVIRKNLSNETFIHSFSFKYVQYNYKTIRLKSDRHTGTLNQQI